MADAVQPGTIAVYSDIACPWGTLAVHTLSAAAAPYGVVVDNRPFPLEVVNDRATPKRVLDAEIPVVGALAPDFGWQMWQRREYDYPISTLLAMEAVQAAKDQTPEASAALDYALRRAFFAQSRTITMRHVVLEVAAEVGAVDVDALRGPLDAGRHRATVVVVPEGVKGSPHVFLPDGRDAFAPGLEMHWEGEEGRGFPVVDAWDPSALEALATRAAAG